MPMDLPPQPSAALVEDLEPAPPGRGRGGDPGGRPGGLFHPRLAFACSLGLEDVALLDLIWRRQLRPRIFFLDTGRLNQETYDTLAAVRGPLRPAHRGVLPAHRGGAGAAGGQGPQFLLGEPGEPPGVLPHPQGGAPGPGPGGGGGLDHRAPPEPRAPPRGGPAALRMGRGQRRAGEGQPPGALEPGPGVGLRAGPPGPLQPPPRPGLPQHRLRPLHPRRGPGGGRALRPLVVGAPRNTGSAACIPRPRKASHDPADPHPHPPGHPGGGGHAHPPGGGRPVPEPGPAVLRRQGLASACCAWRRRPSGPAPSPSPCCTSTPGTTSRRSSRSATGGRGSWASA